MKESLGSALRGFCMLSKGYNRSFIDKGWALRLAFRQLALPKNDVFPWWITGLAYIYQCLKHALLRAGDIFSCGRGHPEPICTCSKLLTIRQLVLPKSDAFAVMDYRTSLYLSMPETRSAQGRWYFSPWQQLSKSAQSCWKQSKVPTVRSA